MGLKVKWLKHTLMFRFEAGTSRGVYTEKDTYFIKIFDSENPTVFGLGEAAPLKGLSVDDIPNFEEVLQNICDTFDSLDLEVFEWNINIILSQLIDDIFPSIKFGFETALLDFLNGGKRVIFNNDFVRSKRAIDINGLVWMGSAEFMARQVREKLENGFQTIKMKVGAINFDEELAILASIREKFSADEITLRVDANGAFSVDDAPQKLKQLANYQIHSIEQPIKPQQTETMANLCQNGAIAVALDEELIGVTDYVQKMQLLKKLKPTYIILKPSLLGGLQHCREWIEIATRLHIGWWMTSALESNIGLNAIAQFTAEYKNLMPQGLGTGSLYHNNIPSPLVVANGYLHYSPEQNWNLNLLANF
ncbi:Mandelate racemase/muconate lactonizing protein [Emticicia oligotrophica DSM 17448]|uniref:Mandelate racemase/muconate lactonizing protein n=1 Tax=Emticicia oligotrophica (strain DSM 17448 / CIP 109782 / MTCC 6937 / GPTSA100-15) TaxID=929562 RepID=A0ABN4APK0_EMTOG|nr:o-succinylbenzoate synthase [Emticicia oligotrophica]AFK04101.1 Mandelate racemase/muconate lactonizing protein [Emticicia oligotrophica DSM 17448]